MTFISRADLGWPASAAPKQVGNPLGIKIHYEGTPVPVQDHSHCKAHWTSVRNSHLANKKEGYSDIAYNLGVCRHGYVLAGRDVGHQTGANGNQALNRAHYSICVMFGTNDKAVPAVVIEGVKEAILRLRAGGAGKEIKGHRDGYATACPGEPLYALVKSGKFEPGKVPAKPTTPTAAYAAFPGEKYFFVGRTSSLITKMGKRLVANGYKGYRFGPGPTFTAADKKAVSWFQRKQGWTGADANGIPGPKTWALLKVPK